MILAFLAGNIWRTFALSLLIAFGVSIWAGNHLLGQRDDAKAALLTSEVARKAAIQIWKAEIDRITGALADAKVDGERAIADKAKAQIEAEAKLKARERYWQGVYKRDPQAKAWAEQAIPASVLEGLR